MILGLCKLSLENIQCFSAKLLKMQLKILFNLNDIQN